MIVQNADRLAGLIDDIRHGRLRKPRANRARPRAMGATVGGTFIAQVLDEYGRVVSAWEPWFNGATYEGLNDALEAVFRAGTQRSAWYAGIISATAFSGVSVNNTMASHAGWSEFVGYNESTRRQWSPPAASGGILANTTVMTFTNGGSSASIQGMFLSSDSTKSGTTGKLWATAADASPRTLAAAQTLQLIYEIDLIPQ